MKDRIYRLKEMLENVDRDSFHYDCYKYGKLEYMIVQSQVEVCHKIASYIEEILDDERKQDELAYDIRKKNVT